MSGIAHAEVGRPEVFKFERRSSPRHEVEGVATAFCLDGERFGDVHDLTLVDYGAGGIAALCDRPLDPGTSISLGFADQRRLARRGVVKRCQPCGAGYRIGVQFLMGLAA